MSIEKVRAYFEHFGHRRPHPRVRRVERDGRAGRRRRRRGGRAHREVHELQARGRCAHHHRDGGDRKIDNTKYKAYFHVKAKMLTFDEACAFTGHAPGGVCSFALPENVKTYLDVSLKRFDTVFPAAGSANSAIEMTCDELEKYSSNFVAWVDVCKEKAPAPQA